MRRLGSFLVLLTLLACALSPATASAAKWTRVSTPTGTSGDEVGLARTSDGVLHVVWIRRNGSAQGLWQTPISAPGDVGDATAVQSGWTRIESPALVAGPDGAALDSFWGGVRSADASDPYQNLNYAYSTDGGSTWTLWPFGTSANGGAAASSGMSAARLSGTFFEAWAAEVHRGVDTTSPVYHFTAAPSDSCCGYDANLAADQTSGAVLVAWFSSQPGYEGVWTQSIDPATGRPIGAAARMPRSATTSAGALRANRQQVRTPLVARIAAPGFAVAYPGGFPKTTRALVWRTGATHSLLAGYAGGGLRPVGLAATSGGRVWVFWRESGRGDIVARRSNPGLTAFGAPVTIELPVGTRQVSKLDGDGQTGPLDLIASMTGQDGIADWYTRVLPTLSLSVSRTVISRGTRTRVVVTVTDADARVRNARVADGSSSARTDANGHATLLLGPFGASAQTTTITVAAARYADADAQLRLRP